MNLNIQDEITKAVANGQLIRAMKLLRTVDNLSVRDAKEKVEAMSQQMQNARSDNYYVEEKNTYDQPLVHTHVPARQDRFNVESDLPTEAFLFFQKGEVKKALKVLNETRGLSNSAANSLARTFYTQHPEYTSDEIEKLMSSRISLARPQSSTSNSKSKSKKSRKGKLGLFEIIVFGIIVFSILRNVAS